MNGQYILKLFLRLHFFRNPFPLDAHSLTVKLCHFVFGERCPLDRLPRTSFHIFPLYTTGYYILWFVPLHGHRLMHHPFPSILSLLHQDLKEIQLQYTRWNCPPNFNQRQIMILFPKNQGFNDLIKITIPWGMEFPPVLASPSPSEMSSASLCTPKNVVSPALKNQENNRPSNRSQKGKDMRQPIE